MIFLKCNIILYYIDFSSSSDGVIDDSDEDKLYVPGCSKKIEKKINFSKKLIFKIYLPK